MLFLSIVKVSDFTWIELTFPSPRVFFDFIQCVVARTKILNCIQIKYKWPVEVSKLKIQQCWEWIRVSAECLHPFVAFVSVPDAILWVLSFVYTITFSWYRIRQRIRFLYLLVMFFFLLRWSTPFRVHVKGFETQNWTHKHRPFLR